MSRRIEWPILIGAAFLIGALVEVLLRFHVAPDTVSFIASGIGVAAGILASKTKKS
jgi:hypothetical protein